MRKLSIIGALLLIVGGAAASSDDRLDRLSDTHRIWLEEEVPYIIAEVERELFLDLETLEERERFIDAFWTKRDPNTATPVNELKEEHYRRIEYANEFLGRETYQPGWRTDRGRYYIILGEPQEVQRYTGFAGLNSTELWFFQGDTAKALPAFFYMMFYKRNDIGQFRLYSPIIDGPKELIQGEAANGDAQLALEFLDGISPELMHAALSFDTSDPPDLNSFQASLGTQMLIARIEESPKRDIRTDYAGAWRDYGSLVSADYSFNFVPNRSAFAVLVGPESTPMLHLSIELDPQNFTLESNEDQTEIYTTLDITLDVRDPDERLVLSLDKEVFVQVPPSRFAQVRAAPFAYQDSFPLIPGDHTVRVVVRNRVGKQFTVAETTLTADSYEDNRPSLGDIVVGHTSRLSADVAPAEMRTFQLGPHRIEPAHDGLFALGERVHLLIQAHASPADHRVRVEMTEDGESKVLQSIEIPVGDGSGALLDQMELESMVGGNFTLRAQLLNAEGKSLSEKTAPIVISPRSTVPRAGFTLRRGFNAQIPGLLPLARGDQHWNLGRTDQAGREYGRAVAADNPPQLFSARWKLASIFIQKQLPVEALKLLVPLESQFPQQYEVQAGLGYAYFLQHDAAQAIDYLEKARTLRPADTQLLNSLADSYQTLGDTDKALDLFSRSLEMDPDQALVKQRLSELGQESRK